MSHASGNTVASPCELCAGAAFELVARFDRRGEPLDTAICRQCGLLRHAQIPTDDQLEEFYEARYRELYHGETAPSDRRVMRAWNAAERIFGRLRKHVATDSDVVEIGAGIGCTVKRFEQAGCNAWGVEPHRGFCDYGRQQLKIHLANQSLADITVADDTVADDTVADDTVVDDTVADDTVAERHELVLLIHVIEHFNHPFRALEQIAALLKPNGLLYVECPNLVAPFAHKSRMFHFAHVHNFSPSTLTALAQRAGFELVQSFADHRSANIEMLFAFRGAPNLQLNRDGYQESMDALRRASGLRYFARREYWTKRIERLRAYGAEFLRATRLVSGLRSPGNPNIKSRNAAPAQRVA